ncbi:MAG TPA: HypC/HybG/HupF family hydrogenase formation chaperone [Bacteroidales bacterium]|jgi:hydrogenase expression/formation protein HypC|nr:HypC/HybG/HupF family hydrogenase formation chaperone [Bacteroidales bacterium]OQB64920.1 MAG: Hydrogenase isoenzymes formation protein HypC [Bacteroidetes bacterium ADurb.Bin145]NMD03674.1 HypC/HybG/HupF family hydrogenase formation chaperone [Bacteroidales bacterium]HOU03214.1 HypC/HybG/HupF family hydrogenase formation chaperone [Bacteroidales bacterium]HQG63703.1 HypC/HybG/HupF family hydrogenase formation chaperone [Bacteroidales bacterium]
MCLSIPVKIISIKDSIAEVSAGGTIFKAGLQMIEDAKPGDYVLLHAGFAIQKISEEEAEETIRIFKEIHDSNNIDNQ